MVLLTEIWIDGAISAGLLADTAAKGLYIPKGAGRIVGLPQF